MRFKSANLDQTITPEMFAHNFFRSNKMCWNPYLYNALWQTMFKKKTNLDQIITPEKAKLGPDNNSTACIYIYIYIYPCTHAQSHRETSITNTAKVLWYGNGTPFNISHRMVLWHLSNVAELWVDRLGLERTASTLTLISGANGPGPQILWFQENMEDLKSGTRSLP